MQGAGCWEEEAKAEAEAEAECVAVAARSSGGGLVLRSGAEGGGRAMEDGQWRGREHGAARRMVQRAGTAEKSAGTAEKSAW